MGMLLFNDTGDLLLIHLSQNFRDLNLSMPEHDFNSTLLTQQTAILFVVISQRSDSSMNPQVVKLL